jgi:hypothetical protein
MLPKKLIPILVYEDEYLYQCSPPRDYPERIKRTALTSQGRLTENCIFTLFSGPTINSEKIITLSPGDEAIFCKLPDYKVKFRWKLEGYAKVWTINSKRTEAYQVYSVSGDLLEMNTGSGCAQIYSFNFPIVVELSFGGRIKIELELGKHLLPQVDPLSVGKKCLVKGGQVYTNIPNGNTLLMDRVIVSQYRNRVAKLRRDYLRVFRLPCRSPLLSGPPTDVQTITIDSGPTIVNYDTSVALSFIEGAFLFVPLWSTLDSTTSSPLQLTDSLGLDVSRLASYAWVSYSGTMRFTINVTVSYSDMPTSSNFGRGDWYEGFGVYSRYELLKLTNGDNASLAATFSDNSAIFSGTLDVVVTKNQYLWFGGYGFVNINATPIYPNTITGTITCQYV